jgi:hypothetical protein
MEVVWLLLVAWWLYLMPLVPVAALIWVFGRRRVQWCRWDFAVTLLPCIVWIAALMFNSTGKTLSNIGEAFYLGCSASLVPIIRVIVGQRANQKWLAIGLLISICLVAVGLWAFVPGLPE